MTNRYPTLRRSVAVDIAKLLVKEAKLLVKEPKLSIDDKVEWQGSGADVDLRPLVREVGALKDKFELATPRPDHEVFEGQLAEVVHSQLVGFPPEVLEDEGFWRYLALKEFWWFIEWREAGPIERGNIATYVDGHLSAESIPVRLFLRGQSVCLDGDYHWASELKQSADFWRSHVLRVRVGSAPHLVRALVELRLRHPMTAHQMRELARLVNRTWSNVALNLYDDESSADLVEGLYQQLVGAKQSGDQDLIIEGQG